MDRTRELLFIQNTGDFGFELTGSVVYALDSRGLPVGVWQTSNRQDYINIASGETISLFDATDSFNNLFGAYRSTVDRYLMVVSYDDL